VSSSHFPVGQFQAFHEPTHVGAAIRLALHSRGVDVAPADIERLVRRRWKIGCWLRDVGLASLLPGFFGPDERRIVKQTDPFLWNAFPHMAGFGYQQAWALKDAVVPGGQFDRRTGTVSAAFGAGIAIVDYVVDEHDMGAILFESVTPDVVEGIFDPGTRTHATLSALARRAPDPRLCLLYALIGACARGFRELYDESGNDTALSALHSVVRRLYEAEREVSLTKASDRRSDWLLPSVEAKSILPFLAAQQIVALGMRSDGFGNENIGLALGRAVALVDDLVDLSKDFHRADANSLLIKLSKRLRERGRGSPTDADLYAVIDSSTRELVALLDSMSTVSASSQCPGAKERPRRRADDEPVSEGFDGAACFARLMVGYWVGWQGFPSQTVSAGAPRRGPHAPVRDATWRATKMLLRQQGAGYGEAVHRLRIPRLSADGVRIQVYSAVLFQRALILDALLDAAAAGLTLDSTVVASEAWALLRAKRHDVPGGWSYISEVPELPPDTDDLALVLQLLCRIGGSSLALTCEEPIRLALAGEREDGGVETWILDPNERSELGSDMRTYVQMTRSGGVHPDVVANFLYGLAYYDAKRFHDELVRGSEYLERSQGVEGAWWSRWYSGPYYGTFRAVLALATIAPESNALVRAQNFLEKQQRFDGSWGEDAAEPLATSLALLALSASRADGSEKCIERGLAFLTAAQEEDGGWPACPFIAFSASDGVTLHSYGSRTITTAFCLKALLSATRDARGGARGVVWDPSHVGRSRVAGAAAASSGARPRPRRPSDEGARYDKEGE
jgi:hypothetical protein